MEHQEIAMFYNGRHHTTVLHAIGKVERLRKTDESIDAPVKVLTAAISPFSDNSFAVQFGQNGALR
jgi:hypothetical protein